MIINLQSRLVQLGIVGLISLGLGAYIDHKASPPETTVQIVHDIQQVKVEVPTLTEKIVDRIVTDPKQQEAIKTIFKENNELKLKITQLNSTVATSQSTGGTRQGGAITANPVVRTMPSSNETGTYTVGDQTRMLESDNPSSHYEDWQLKADYSSSEFTYDLFQTFIVESTVGKDKEGVPTGITRLFQVGPSGDLRAVPAKTTVIKVDDAKPHWFISPRGQLGVGTNLTNLKEHTGVVAVQWLKFGKSKAPEDIKWSVGSPSLSLSTSKVIPGILPISYNLGSIKHSPVSNVWISPSIDKAKTIGIVLSLTF